MSTTIRVDGVKEAIKELRSIDPELRRTFTKNVKQITKPIVQAAQAAYRSQNFPSGTKYKWAPKGREVFPLTNKAAIRGVTTKISTSRKQQSAITVMQGNPGGAVFEFAEGGLLGQAFTRKNGRAARVMWPAADRNIENVQQEMTKLVDDLTNTINRKLY